MVFAVLWLVTMIRTGRQRAGLFAFVLLALSSLVMYVLADGFFLWLWLPSRYVQYTVPIVCVAIVSLAIDRLVAKIPLARARVAAQTFVVAILLLHFDLNQSAALDNQSDKKELFMTVAALPKGAMIAAHPMLADYIPTFSRRKVFLNYELSQPYKDRYWLVLKERTFEFFNAYYSTDISSVVQFCQKNKIDYLIVDRRHFTSEFLRANRLYFEPFNSYLKELTRDRSRYALASYAGERREIMDNSIYIVDVRALGQ